ncbi:MAG TPA: hypothetical protein VFO41_03730 [Alphaproteobacteria bacterium]|nr:hypothetical protein [Alphaproteobacteria bacterium]
MLDITLRLLSWIAIAAACLTLALTLGPFYVAGEISEWWRNRKEPMR